MIEIAKTEDVVLLITPLVYALEIIEELDKIRELDGVDCYVLDLMQEHCTTSPFSFTKGEDVIPRKIHYCWFGEGKKVH